jgi:hypothetical protein
VKINVDLQDELASLVAYDVDGEPVQGQPSLADAVLREAASQLLATLTRVDRDGLAERIRAIRDQVIRENIAEQVGLALAAPITRTSPWGEAKGEPVTVRELIRLELEAFLNSKATRDRFDSSSTPAKSLAELISQECRSVMSMELTKDVAAAKAEVGTAIRTRALTAAVAAISPKD